jgi:hypothetical protein
MHRFDRRTVLGSATHIRLIGYDDQEEMCRLEASTGVHDTIVELEFLHACRRVGPSVADDRTIEDAVTIEENSASLY